MAQNFIAPGEVLDIVAPVGGITTGVPILIGGIVGVALNSAAQGATAQVQTVGAFRSLPKVAGTAWAVGDKLYWDNAAKNFTTVSAGNTFAGFAYAAALAADVTGSVLLANGI